MTLEELKFALGIEHTAADGHLEQLLNVGKKLGMDDAELVEHVGKWHADGRTYTDGAKVERINASRETPPQD